MWLRVTSSQQFTFLAAQVIRTKRYLLQAAAVQTSLDILLLQETLRKCIVLAFLDTYLTLSPSWGIGGGCMVLIRKSYSSSGIPQPAPCDQNMEIQAVYVSVGDRELLMYNKYIKSKRHFRCRRKAQVEY